MDARPDEEFEELESDGSSSEEEVVQPGEEGAAFGEEEEEEAAETRVYLPGDSLGQDEELVMDRSAYRVHAEFTLDWPALSFDIVPDDLGDKRSTFPLTTYMVAGTQAGQTHQNKLMLMKVSNIQRMKHSGEMDESESESENEEDTQPVLNHQSVNHRGAINRVKVAPHEGCIVASWSDAGKVHVWDMSAHAKQLQTKESQKLLAKPRHTFEGHPCEGFALAWSPVVPYRLASGDCDKYIHVWDRHEGGSWVVNKAPCVGHEASVEDIAWSPNEPHVFVSGSVDQSVKVWDVRASQKMALSIHAHDCDVNVLTWNRREQHLLATGGDDGTFKIWDLRTFMGGGKPEPVAAFKWHSAPVTSIEWHPTDPSVLAVSGADDQVSIWDMSVEEDPDAAQATGDVAGLPKVPAQLLFVHQGQRNIKEIHWHPQITGLLASTAESGFNVFRPISV